MWNELDDALYNKELERLIGEEGLIVTVTEEVIVNEKNPKLIPSETSIRSFENGTPPDFGDSD